MLTHKGTVPLQTGRLKLRRFTPADSEAMLRNWAADEKTTKFLTWEPYTDLEKVREFVQKCIDKYETGDCYEWTIEFEGEIIGTINLHALSLVNETCELGYCIGSRWWNRGIVSEAAAAVIRFAFTELGAYKVTALHDILNPASGRVMQKCAMTCEATLREQTRRKDGTRGDMAFYSILRNEWSDE